jgi:hypothetical protein
MLKINSIQTLPHFKRFYMLLTILTKNNRENEKYIQGNTYEASPKRTVQVCW